SVRPTNRRGNVRHDVGTDCELAGREAEGRAGRRRLRDGVQPRDLRGGENRVVRPVAGERFFAEEKEARRKAAPDRKRTLHLAAGAKHVPLPGRPSDASDRPTKATTERWADQRGA